MLILCVFVCSCWRRRLPDPRKVSVWRREHPHPVMLKHPCAVWRERPAPRGSNLLQGLCRPTWEAQSWLGWLSKVESFISIFSSSLFEQHGDPYLCILRSGLAGRRENSQRFGCKNRWASVWFSLPVFHVLKLGVFRKETLLETVAETKAWHNQQVLGFFISLFLLCVCAASAAGLWESLPFLPFPRTSFASRCWSEVFFIEWWSKLAHQMTWDNWFSFRSRKCLKELKNLTGTIGFVYEGILNFSATSLTCRERLRSGSGSVPKESKSGENYSYTCFCLSCMNIQLGKWETMAEPKHKETNS